MFKYHSDDVYLLSLIFNAINDKSLSCTFFPPDSSEALRAPQDQICKAFYCQEWTTTKATRIHLAFGCQKDEGK